MLLGQFEGKVTEKHQAVLPKQFRKVLGNKVIITKGLEECLLIVSESNWKTLLEGTEGRPFTKKDVRQLQRYLLGNATIIETDSLGRFVLPEYLRRYASIKADVIYAGISRFVEVWNKEKWEEQQKILAQNAPSIAERLDEVERGSNRSYHVPVLLQESVDYLQITSGEKYIDATLGGGGHSIEIIKRGGIVLGIDQDDEAIAFVRQNLPDERMSIVQGNFKDMKEIAAAHDFHQVAGIFFDLGVSSHQFNEAERGFSFLNDAPLDMRMDRSLGVTAADLINGLNKSELLELFTKLGEETYSWKIVPAIIRERENKKIETTQQLAKIIEKIVPGKKEHNPATKVFQALRMAVNDELQSLRETLPQTLELLKPKGRLVVISFHSLEDRLVKHAFLDFAKQNLGSILTRKPIEPSEVEIKENPRGRSAKMRVFERSKA